MDATVGFINVNQNKDIKRLTVMSLIFMPLNVLAGIGGMSEFSMMTTGIPWQIAYSSLCVGLVFVAWSTYVGVQFFERRKIKRIAIENQKILAR
jgi:magnesium transporter